MMAIVRVTANFRRNIGDIRDYLLAADATYAFEQLQLTLFDIIIPNLERFPDMSRDFLARKAHSAESRVRLEKLKKRLGNASLREYIHSDYLILYARRDEVIHLLAIRHHRQLSFDLLQVW